MKTLKVQKTIVCSKCKKRKMVDLFSQNRSTKSGRQAWCITCTRIYSNSVSHIYRDKVHFGGNRFKVLERDRYSCVKCGMTNSEHKKRWKREITVDHIDGNGRNSKTKNNKLDNLQTLCASCHCRKDIARRKYSVRTACFMGHPYIGKNFKLVTHFHTGKMRTFRRCRICMKRESSLRWAEKKRQNHLRKVNKK